MRCLSRPHPSIGVAGKLEARDNVVHVIADELWTPRLEVQPQHGGAGMVDFTNAAPARADSCG